MTADDAIRRLTELSARYGADPMLVQGAGGNVSVKCGNGSMYIKSSGKFLRELNNNFGWVAVPHSSIASLLASQAPTNGFLPDLDDWLAEEIDKKTDNTKCGGKASIETAMHAVLRRYVVHLHPVILNVILCSTEAKDLAKSVFSEIPFIWIEVNPPGYYTARAIYEAVSSSPNHVPDVIFLANHGVIVHSDSIDDVVHLYHKLLTTAESWFVKLTGQSIKFSIEQWPEELSHSDLFPDTVVFHDIAHQIDSLNQNKKTGVVETFAASRLIRKAHLAADLKPAHLAQDICQYIQGMSREKHRQGEAKK